MNYLNYLYELVDTKFHYQKLIEFIQELSSAKNKEIFNLIFNTHLEYVLLKIPNESSSINYCINLINNIYIIIFKDNFYNNFLIIKKNKINRYSNLFNCLFNNPNLSFENKFKILEELVKIVGEDNCKKSKFIKNIHNYDLLYFYFFYKKKILNKIILNIQNGDNIEEQEMEAHYIEIMSEYFQIGYLFEFIYKLSKKNKSIFMHFNNYLDNFVNDHPYLTKKYKYNYSNETFQIIKYYIFLNAKNGFFSHLQGNMDEKLFLEFITNNEKLSNFNLKNPKNALYLEKILLSNKYDYTDYIINNWNIIFPISQNKEKKYNKDKPEIDGDNTESEEEIEEEDNENENEDIEEEFLINLDNFIKSILSLDYSKKELNKINYDKLFTFLESKIHIIIKYFSYSVIPNYYDMHKNLMNKNQPPSYYRFCISYILNKNIIINYKNINYPKIRKYNLMTKAFKPEMNIFIKNTINNLVYNWKENFNYSDFLNEIKQRVCIYCLLLINIYDTIDNRLKDVSNFFNNFLYVLEPDIEKYMNPYKEVMIYYCNNLKNKPYNSNKIRNKNKINNNNKESIVEQKNSYWLIFYKIMILIYIRKKFNDKFNPELLWECLNNYYDIKGIFNLLVDYSKDKKFTIENIFEKELIPRFCIFTNKRVYFNILNKIKDKEFIKILVDRRNEVGISDISNLFIEILERLSTNKNLFNYLWESFDLNYKQNLIKNNSKIFIKAYLDYTFKRFHFFQNIILEGLKLVFTIEELKSLKLLDPLREEYPIKINYEDLKIIN